MELDGSSARTARVVTAVAVVLALIGVVGAVSGAADKSGDDKDVTAIDRTTTTEVTDNTLLPGVTVTSTSLLAGPTTTLKGATTTTAKPGTTATTTVAGGVGDCPAGAAAGPDPAAAITPPAVGVYQFVSCTDSSKSADYTIAKGSTADRRLVTQEQAGVEQTTTVQYRGDGSYQESVTLGVGFAVKCDWDPDVLQYPQPLANGKTWTVESKCTITTPQGNVTLRISGSGKVSGRVTTSVGGTAVNAWIVETVYKLSTPNGDVNASAREYFDPVHGLAVYRHVETKTAQGSGTVDEKLKSLTPKAS